MEMIKLSDDKEKKFSQRCLRLKSHKDPSIVINVFYQNIYDIFWVKIFILNIQKPFLGS